MNAKDNRRHPRVDEKVLTRVRIKSAPGVAELEGREFECHSRDISMSGVRLKVDVPVPSGSLLELEITLGDPPVKYRFTGKTVWAGKPGGKAAKQRGGEIGMELQLTADGKSDSWKNALLNLYGQS